MAKQKKRATAGKRKPTPRGKVRKSARGKAAKRTAAKSKPRKRLAKAMRKHAAAKHVGRKRKRPATPPTTSAVETVTTDVIEEAAPGEIAITEFEETQEREEGEGPERPEETPPESEER
jgi:hypothetical protein